MELVLRRRYWIVVAVLAVVCVLVAGRVHAQDVSLFSNRARLVQSMDNNPELVVAALEQVLSPEQAAVLEALLDVTPDDREKERSLREAKRLLIEAGLDASDDVVQGVDGKLAEVEARLPEASGSR